MNNNNTNTARVTFRVKCDDTATIGHGEDVLLVDSEGIKVRAERSNASSIIIIIITNAHIVDSFFCYDPPPPSSISLSRLSPCQYIMITFTSY